MDIELRSVIQEVTKLCKNFTNLSLQNSRVTREALYFMLPMKLSGMVQKKDCFFINQRALGTFWDVKDAIK